MKIAIAQLNVTVGDLDGNARRIADAAARARAAGASLLLTTELALSGYPPEDLLLRDDFFRACDAAFRRLMEQVAGITVVLGHPHQVGGRRYNAASVIRDGRVIATYLKQSLPNYTVFDERRYFDSGESPCVFEHEGLRLGINICEDVWEEPAAKAAREAGAQLLLVLNASPYHIDKRLTRHEVVRERVGKTGMGVVYANQVGGQDELVFDGASFTVDDRGELTHQFAAFEEVLGLVEIRGGTPVKGEIAPAAGLEQEVYRALTLGVRDYLGKNGFPGALLGLSGGIDSALTLAVAVDALGPDKVHAVMMPSQYTAGMSSEDARRQAETMGVRYSEIPIRPVFDAFRSALAEQFRGLKEDVTEENLQARIRGTLLMAMSNKTGAIVLTTGNKSEMGTGYATLYGDMAGGFAVLKDIKKTLVYRLSEYRNTQGEVIPRRVIERAPSAELRPDQKDQDSLPPYDVLDAIMEAYVERYRSPQEIVAMGYAQADVERVVKLLRASEYKRRQAPVGIRITNRGFGKDWRYPITNRFRH
ncbi:MAG: NAD+ synthase [Betaproteobacteria bacterium]|jgi:NAD+ synthase (glutamine-hydrolysing)|nr:NAD+ synthase [Betaproteobacteria bacterium]